MAYESETNMEKLELTEKDLEELANIRLKTGLSDSVVELVVEEKKVEKRKKSWIGPPIPKDRDAMGRYVVPEGGKPLSNNDSAPPGPGHYSPCDAPCALAAPAYTLGEVFNRKAEKSLGPGPGKYNTGKSADWGRCKRITIKEKKEIRVVSPSPGPAAYSPPRIPKGPKFSIKGRQRGQRATCYVSKLAHQLDPSVPGPSYLPDSKIKPVTFGTKIQKPKEKTGPGPNKYAPNKADTGPKWPFGRSLAVKVKGLAPGPGKYNIRSTIGDAPRAVCIARRDPTHKWSDTPGPDIYNRAGFDLSEPGYTMKYRWFDTDAAPTPGPATYNPHPEQTIKGAAYSFKSMTKPTYPSNVYAHLTVEAPGPNSYMPTTPKIPGKSFGTPAAPKLIRFGEPGPADYGGDKPLARAPAFSISGRARHRPDRADIPGPGTYTPQHGKTAGGKTFGVKTKAGGDTPGPGPASYLPCGGAACAPCESAGGATLKSRHTPLQYSGLRANITPKGPQPPPQPFFAVDPACL